ncbi:MAG: ABC transporter substrate-binding protein [Aestuariivirga sp.]|nr:ABC transporter substrate-binding protein [Aestuariivirga sp.]
MADRGSRALKPKKGGRMRLGLNGASPTDSLDPGQLTDTFAAEVSFGQTRNCLVELNEKHEAVGELAESWVSSPGADTWHFQLRKGVEFHNGKSLTSEDVVYTLQQHFGAGSKSMVRILLKPIKSVKADGPTAVVFELEAGNIDFPYILSDYHLSIVPAGTAGTDYEKGIGTGGYILKDWKPGVRALTIRNPNYWKQGRAHFDEVETLAMNDVSARTEALIAGKVDIIDQVDLQTLEALEKTPGIKIVRTSEMRHNAISMRTDRAPFNNNHVRLALKFALDRDAVLKEVQHGQGKLGNDTPIGPGHRYFANEIPQRKYDPDKAKWHLRQAGLNQLRLELTTADVAFAGAVKLAHLYKEHALRAGIEMSVTKVPDEIFWPKAWMESSWRTSYWSGHVIADWILSAVYAHGSPWNETYWSNDRFNRLLVAARSEQNEDLRRRMYVKMQQIIHDDGGAVIPVFADHVAAVRDNVTTPDELIPAWGFDGHKAMERWWFA